MQPAGLGRSVADGPREAALSPIGNWPSRIADQRSNFSLHLYALLALSLIGLTPVALFGEFPEPSDGVGDDLKQLCFLLLLGSIVASILRRHGAKGLLRIPPLLALLLGWLWLSIGWAIDPAVAARRTAFCTIVILGVCYTLEELAPEEVLRVLMRTCIAIVVLDWIAVALLPLALHQGAGPEPELAGDWRGLHAHKNEAGAFLAFFIILLLHAARRRRILLAASLLVPASAFLYLSHSKTAEGFLPIAIVAGWLAVPLQRWPAARLLAAITLAALALVAQNLSIAETIGDYMSDPAALTGRVQIWPLMLDYASDHPWLGSGYGSFWSVSNAPIYEYTSGWLTTINHAHNGYLNLLVQVGFVGLAIAVLALLLQPLRLLFSKPMQQDHLRFFLAATLVFAYLNNLLESSLLDRANPVWVFLLIAYALLQRISRPAQERTPAA